MEGTSNSAVGNQGGCGGLHPSVLFLLGTLGLTSCATAMLCAAIMTDHWENVSWNQTKIKEINDIHLKTRRNLSKDLMIEALNYLDGHVTRVSIRKEYPFYGDSDYSVVAAVFLVPMHGGIWTLCVSLEDEQARLLSTIGYNQTERCVNYLPPLFQRSEEPEQRPDWQHRMQNLSISCALVCLIILGSSALVGAFGVLKHQISAVLVTGVMYLLAATFALFTLTIIHFKRQQTKSRGVSRTSTDCLEMPLGVRTLGDGVSPNNRTALDPTYTPVWADYYPARTYTVGWSLDLGWGGVTLCVLTSVLWILLSKIMRYNPISTTLLA